MIETVRTRKRFEQYSETIIQQKDPPKIIPQNFHPIFSPARPVCRKSRENPPFKRYRHRLSDAFRETYRGRKTPGRLKTGLPAAAAGAGLHQSPETVVGSPPPGSWAVPAGRPGPKHPGHVTRRASGQRQRPTVCTRARKQRSASTPRAASSSASGALPRVIERSPWPAV